MEISRIGKTTEWQHRIKLIAWFNPTYENPCGFFIRFVFAKLVAETRN